MQKFFGANGNYTDMSMSVVTLLPGHRVPTEGTGKHEEDAYSLLFTQKAGEFSGLCKAGEATLIPRGEAHWCENRTDKPYKLACVLLK